MSHQTLKDKVIAITGAASGLGHAIALEAAARGAILALSDLNTDALDKVVKDLKQNIPSLQASHQKLDVTSSSDVDAWIAGVVSQFSRLDGAANVAGMDSKPGVPAIQPITELSDEKWQFLLDVNLTGVFYCLRAEMRAMKESGGGGSIVNMSSIGGLKSGATLAGYIASKHGVVGLTKTAAAEGAAFGVRVNAVCPGPIDTPLLRRINNDNPEVWAAWEKMSPMNRMGKAEEVAKMYCFLLSDESSWTTGTTLPLDGGGLA